MGRPRQLYMDAVITPNRSLSKRGLYIVLGLFGAYNLILGAFLLAVGAFPVPIFLGLDFVGLTLAFRISNRRARRAERVRVCAERVEVDRRDRTVWSSPTAFTRVTLDDADHAWVALHLSGHSLALAHALSPRERAAFAAALERAIAAARGERHAAGVA